MNCLGQLPTNLSTIKNKDELYHFYKEKNPHLSETSLKDNTDQIWTFIREMIVGDMFLISMDQGSRIGVGCIVSNYIYKDMAEESEQHIRYVRWLNTISKSMFEQSFPSKLDCLENINKICRIPLNTGAENILKSA
ncbi:hypothetical protein [Methanosalsum natronophilum]|uniref:hypothetical protein n=1 Tax=Methanosalsum natronophilum TaxID=768733 RepID=UPI002168914F|nr:hypothetical protein [Methanosalsum natronophilum]MCS3923579.1 putative Mrr-cat superfamily restriction endonuclease [Methanosalsum natronophilum]